MNAARRDNDPQGAPRLREYRKLHAEWYELGSAERDHTLEIDFWERLIAETGGPALELGSGTGRVLVPLLQRGWDVSGIDTSPDMMDRCRQACAAGGLSPDLHEQPMQSFRLPRRFGLVMLTSGGLGLFTGDADIRSVFQCVMEHLEPGGLFVYEFEQTPIEGDRHRDDGRWAGDWVRGAGDVVIAWRRRHKYDVATQTWKQLMIFEKFVSGRLVDVEADEREGRFFSVDQATHYAKVAGFERIVATEWLCDSPPRPETRVVTVRCRKPPSA